MYHTKFLLVYIYKIEVSASKFWELQQSKMKTFICNAAGRALANEILIN